MRPVSQNNANLLRAKERIIEITLGVKAALTHFYFWRILKNGEDFDKW